MKARIHRGAHEIGGNCIEVEAQGARLLLDLGQPITTTKNETLRMPSISGLDGNDPSFMGIVLSHPHLDHYGLIPRVAGNVPLFMGEAASRILCESAFFTPVGLNTKPFGFLRHRESFAVGPFRITAYLNDHSAFDAYSLLVESDDRRLFYTGDIRAHGRKASFFEQLLHLPPARIDALLMEGTQVRHDGDRKERGPSEVDVENDCVETFASTRGMALAMYSPQNIDRLVSMYKAAIRSRRELVIDLYTAAIVAATGSKSIPQPSWDKVRVYLPNAQRSKVISAKAFERTEAVRERRIYGDELRSRRAEIVMTFRYSMARELIAARCLEGAAVVWSMWPGYLKTESGQQLQAFLDEQRIPLVVHHASGHAFVGDLQRLLERLAPKRVIPVHSFATDRFAEFFPRVEQHADGEWWDV